MTIVQINYFLAAEAAGSLTQAADELGVSQPTLSEQVRKLEQQLGVPLFTRAKQGVTLTEAGQRHPLLAGLPAAPTVFHWHGDTFNVPAGAVHLATSDGCLSQAFVVENRLLGLQFHLESTAETVATLVAHCGEELVPGRYIQSAPQIGENGAAHFPVINRLMETLLDRLA